MHNIMSAIDIDMNIDNYTLEELMRIIDIDVEELQEDTILEKTNYFIQRFQQNNPELSSFFRDVQEKLLFYANDLEEEEQNVQPVITDARQNVGIFENTTFPMERETLETNDTFNVPVKQDTLNPNLKNTISRFINLDSQFRAFSGSTESSSTNYTCDLSDTLKNAIKLSLYSFQIPYSWYTIDSLYGNSCLWINDVPSGIIVPISIPSGNYTQTQFKTALNNAFTTAGFTFPAPPSSDITVPVHYNANSGIITLYLNDATYNGSLGSFTVTTSTEILFYDFLKTRQCLTNCSNKNHYFNSTLGWIMGYRLPYVNVEPNGNAATCILDLNGTKYLILVIDDYNQNHVNNTLVSITNYSNVLKMPSYYSSDIPYTCITPSQQGNNLNNLMSISRNGLLLAGKFQEDFTPTQIVLPSAPRTLTNAQLYTINSINNNNNNLTNYLASAPTSSDILAILPVKTSVESTTGTMLVEFSGSLQDNVRTYFGPVDIDRMAVKLLDDKGNVLNLNGTDWCVTLIAECLYQY